MRTRQWLLAMTFCGVGVALAACSSSDSTNTSPSTGTDSGATSSDAGGTCTKVDLTTVDAGNLAINDAGATTGTCISCMKSSCTSQLSACSGDCTCDSAVSSFADCLGQGKGASCFTTGFSSVSTDPNALTSPIVPLLQCMYASCKDPCGINVVIDAGTTTTTDSGSTSVADAASD